MPVGRDSYLDALNIKAATMDPQTMTDEQIHQLGIEALVNQLGLLGTIRFLQQYGTEGNYSVDRHQWLSELDVKTLAKQIQQAREDKGEESCV